ncbi:MAG: hypothetical protein WDA22_15190 [Bacteroidota bacterium]
MNRSGKITLLRKIYDYFLKKWFFSLAIITLPSIIIFSNAFYHSFIDHTNSPFLKIHEMLISFLFVPTFIFALFKSIADYYNSQAKDKGQIILLNIMQTLNEAIINQTKNTLKTVHKLEIGTILEKDHILDILPETEFLLNRLRKMFREIFGIDEDNISISIVYRLNKGKWNWLHSMNIIESKDLSLEEIISNPNSSARQVIDGKKKEIFFLPDKRVGSYHKMYVESERDRECGGIGSIICSDVSVESKSHKLEAILNITTYKKQLCHIKDRESIFKIEKFIIDPINIRVKNNLSFLLLKKLMKNKEN